ncbi:hypothetical protein PVK06_002409 [Gossypium arboreum]|uniref:Uncharacterized protein n=1 Tax=Gossypium arboreum TaxID=29729 RepID=A0ABR0R4J5_GOSAR|nr:hypothetical protein PVK06_002409 [Gossypium arboreum]
MEADLTDLNLDDLEDYPVARQEEDDVGEEEVELGLDLSKSGDKEGDNGYE